MKTEIIEQPIILASVIKWLLLASCVGGIVGGAATFFVKTLDWMILLTHRTPFYFYGLPLALAASYLIIKYVAPDAEGYGAKIIEAIHKHSGRIPPLVAPVKFVTAILTISFGGSAGKTGPCVKIGAGLASTFASFFRFNKHDRRKLVICGISAGFATIFGTTLSSAIFGIEVLYVGAIFYDVLFPAYIAGMVAYQVAIMLGMTYHRHFFQAVPAFSSIFFLEVIFTGIVCGLCALILIEGLRIGKKSYHSLPIHPLLKGIFGGLLLILLTTLFSDRYLGLGLETIQACLDGQAVVPYTFLLKMLFTIITLNFCGSGGVITPILFIGATLGNVIGRYLGLDHSLFSAIGMLSLFAGAANTPITASILSFELFGRRAAPYTTIACIISFLMAGHRTVYPSQILLFTKSEALVVEKNTELGNIHTLRLTNNHSYLLERLRALWEHGEEDKAGQSSDHVTTPPADSPKESDRDTLS